MKPASLMLAALLLLSPVLGAAAFAQPAQEPSMEKARPAEEAREDPEASAEAQRRMQRLAETIEVLAKVDPKLAAWLDELKDQEPEAIEKAIHQRFPRLGRLIRMRRHNPEMFDLRIKDMYLAHETRTLAMRVRRLQGTDDASKELAELRSELETLVAEHFEVRQQIRRWELARLEARLAELREQLAEKQQNRAAAIAARLEELLKEDDAE